MVQKKVTIKNPTGMNLRPAENLCKVALRYQAHSNFEFNGGTFNLKSILSVLGSSARCGDEITVTCSGPEEQEALAAIIKAIEAGLGE